MFTYQTIFQDKIIKWNITLLAMVAPTCNSFCTASNICSMVISSALNAFKKATKPVKKPAREVFVEAPQPRIKRLNV